MALLLTAALLGCSRDPQYYVEDPPVRQSRTPQTLPAASTQPPQPTPATPVGAKSNHTDGGLSTDANPDGLGSQTVKHPPERPPERPVFRVGPLVLTLVGVRPGAGGSMCYVSFEAKAERRIGFTGIEAYALSRAGDVIDKATEILPHGLDLNATRIIEFAFASIPCRAIGTLKFQI